MIGFSIAIAIDWHTPRILSTSTTKWRSSSKLYGFNHPWNAFHRHIFTSSTIIVRTTARNHVAKRYEMKNAWYPLYRNRSGMCSEMAVDIGLLSRLLDGMAKWYLKIGLSPLDLDQLGENIMIVNCELPIVVSCSSIQVIWWPISESYRLVNTLLEGRSIQQPNAGWLHTRESGLW